jgi:hypothetical protein
VLLVDDGNAQIVSGFPIDKDIMPQLDRGAVVFIAVFFNFRFTFHMACYRRY